MAFEVLQQKLHDLLEVKVGRIVEDLLSLIILDFEDVTVLFGDVVILVEGVLEELSLAEF